MNLMSPCMQVVHGYALFFAVKNQHSRYTVVLSGYTPIRASLYPLDRFFPIAMNYGFVTNRCYRSVSFFRVRENEILLSFPIFICSLSCDFYGPDKWTSVSANFFLFERNIRDRLDFDVSSLINNSTTLINLQYFFY